MSPLEQAALVLGEELRRAQFGQRLQELHPSRRADQASFLSLASYEVNSGPAIRRTLQTLHLTKLAGEPLEMSDDDREYIAWVIQAWRAMQRIAGKCWVPMRSELRTMIVDEDDLGPNASHYIPATRVHETGPALKFAGLDSTPVQGAIDALVAACRSTPCYRTSVDALSRVEEDSDLRKRIDARSKRILGQIQPPERMTIHDAENRARLIVRQGYEDAEADVGAVAHAVRAHNELINYLLFAILGLAETPQTFVVGTESGPVRARRNHRLLWVHFATFDQQSMFMGNPPAPFVLAGETPLDGLYMLEGTTVRFAGRGLVDVHARRLRELEESPVSAPEYSQ